MRAFIVRPFKRKRVGGVEVDFDEVEAKLIAPALVGLEIAGRTTGEFLAPGNIREDMFQLLLTADIVVADITLHNANVYYELGIRHALRDKRTLLLRGAWATDDKPPPDAVPFDLLTDRYLAYDLADPGASLPALTEALRQSLARDGRDSPVYRLLPGLRAPSSDDLLAVPVDFDEEVRRAAARVGAAKPGDDRNLVRGDLDLLATEARGLYWGGAGLRLVGRTQFNLGHYEGAKLSWEAVRACDAGDVEANQKLSTVYQKLSRAYQDPDCLEASDSAARRALERSGLDRRNRAEVHALIASNAKVRWQLSFQGCAEAERAAAALKSPWLDKAIAAYADGFRIDRNHYYSGINALALRVVQRELARALPEVWAMRFDDERDAEAALENIEAEIARTAPAVALALETARVMDEPADAVWVEFTDAELSCLTSDRPPRVGLRYGRVNETFARTHAFALRSARDQLLMLQAVGVLPDNVAAALQAFVGYVHDAPPGPAPGRILLFTGHMVDAADREAKGRPARFPRTPEAEAKARAAIAERARAVSEAAEGVALGIAGGASGGDILFHEVCAEMRVPTRVYLTLAPALYLDQSVRPGGESWVRRFDTLLDRRPIRILSDLKAEHTKPDTLPRWLQNKPDYTIWQRTNLWMLHNALAAGPQRVTLIALWDGAAEGDGPGGTSDLVAQARARGARVEHIDTRALFGLGPASD